MTGYLSSLASKTASGLKSVASTTASGLGTVASTTANVAKQAHCLTWSNTLLSSVHQFSTPELQEMLQTCKDVKERNKCADGLDWGLCEPLEEYIRGRDALEINQRIRRQFKKNAAAVAVQKEARRAAALRETAALREAAAVRIRDDLRNKQRKQQIQQEYKKKLVTIYFPKLSKKIAKEILVAILKYRKKPHEACEKSESDKHYQICAIQYQMSKPYFLEKIYGANPDMTATNEYGLEKIVKRREKDIESAARKADVPDLYSEIFQKLNEQGGNFIKLHWDKIKDRAGYDFEQQVINEHADGIAELLHMLSFDQNLLSDIGKDIEKLYGIDNLLTHFENSKKDEKTATGNRFSNLGGGGPGGVTADLLSAIQKRPQLKPKNNRRAAIPPKVGPSVVSAKQNLLAEIQNKAKPLRPVQQGVNPTSETLSEQQKFVNALQNAKRELKNVNAGAVAARATAEAKMEEQSGKENAKPINMPTADGQNQTLKAVEGTRNKDALARARNGALARARQAVAERKAQGLI